MIVTGVMDPNRRSDKFQVHDLILLQMTSAQITSAPPAGMGYTVGSGGNITGQIYDKNTTKAQDIAASLATRPYSDWAYYEINHVTHEEGLIQASFFKPDYKDDGVTATGAVDNYIYQDYVAKGKPGDIFRYVADTGNATTNATNLKTSIAANGQKLYYVDGDITIDDFGAGNGSTNLQITVIVKGKVWWTGNNGPYVSTVPSDWGLGIAILAGGGTASPTAPTGCANTTVTCSSGHAVGSQFSTSGNGDIWKGILYVPNGNVDISANVSMTDLLGPVVAWSMAQGQCGNANNFHFGECTSCWVHPPKFGTGLIGMLQGQRIF